MTMLICPDCRNENEIERIYCHDCGTKLDRSKLKKDKSIVKEEKPEETQKRIRRMFGGRADIYKQPASRWPSSCWAHARRLDCSY